MNNYDNERNGLFVQKEAQWPRKGMTGWHREWQSEVVLVCLVDKQRF